MGSWKPFHKSCRLYDDIRRDHEEPPAQFPPAPNPLNFTVLRTEQYGNHWVSEVHFPDCTNFEGRKVVVTSGRVEGRESFDPHFDHDGFVVARFSPTEKGWALARKCVGQFL